MNPKRFPSKTFLPKVISTMLLASAPAAVYSQVTAAVTPSPSYPIPSVVTYSGSAGAFSDPGGVAVDSSGNIYVADYGKHRVVKIAGNGGASTVITYTVPTATTTPNESGVCTDTAGGEPNLAITTGTPGPDGIAVDSTGDLYIADADNNLIVKIPAASAKLGTATGQSYVSTGSYSLCAPEGLTVDASNNLYIADTWNQRVLKVTSSGTTVVPGVPCSGTVSGGLCSADTSTYPTSVALDATGNVYFTSADTNGSYVYQVPVSGSGYAATPVTFIKLLNEPYGLFISGSTLYVTDTVNGNVYWFPLTLTAPATFLNATHTLTGLSGPDGLWVDSKGNLFVQNASSTTDTTKLYVNQLLEVDLGSVTVPPATLAAGNGAVYTATINNAPGVPAYLALGQSSCTSACTYNLGGTNGTINYAFLSVTKSSALLVVYVPTGVTGGTYTLPISAGAEVVGNFSLTIPVILKPQTITFAKPAAQVVGTPLTLSATGGASGNPVTFASTTPSVCSVSGTTATFIVSGTCSITASQAGNSAYSAAAPVTQSFAVYPKVTVPAETLARNSGNFYPVTITGASSAPSLALNTLKSGVSYAFLSVSTKSATLVIYAPSTATAGTYALPITINGTQVGTFSLTVK